MIIHYRDKEAKRKDKRNDFNYSVEMKVEPVQERCERTTHGSFYVEWTRPRFLMFHIPPKGLEH